MVHIVGAGPGATDLITVRGARLLKEADVIIYAGSLVNKELLELAKEGAEVYDSARMTLEEVMAVIKGPGRKKRRSCAFIQGIPASMGRSESRWTPWIRRKSPMKSAPALVPSAEQHPLWGWNIRFRGFPRA